MRHWIVSNEFLHISEGLITNKTDMWAYGLILWEMIALSPPHVEIDETMDESMFNGSYLGLSTDGDSTADESLNDSLMILEEKIRSKYGEFFFQKSPFVAIISEPMGNHEKSHKTFFEENLILLN